MILPTAEPWLSASISAPAAWAAFAAVQQLPWSLQITSWSPLRFEVSHSFDFQVCLDQAGAFAFPARARGEIALRILTLALGLDERQLRMRHLSLAVMKASATDEEEALRKLERVIIARIQQELSHQFDVRPETWADRLRAAVEQLPDVQSQQVVSYSGLDQELSSKQCAAGLKYAFSTLEPALERGTEGVSLKGHPRKLGEARAARHAPDPKARARNLAVRAIEARLALLHAEEEFDDILFDLDADSLLAVLKDDLLQSVQEHGCWGLIDLTIRRDRLVLGHHLPSILPEHVWDLIRQQERRVDLAELKAAS